MPTRFDRSILQRHLHKVSHLFRRLLLHPGSDMGVSIQRKTRGKMSQHMGQRLDVDAILQGNCGKSVPICYNKDKSGNPLKIKEKRTCPCSFSNHIPGKIRPQRPWTERGCCIKDKAKFTKSRARTCKHRKQNTAVQRNCRSSAPAQVNRPPTQWTASTPQDQYTLFRGNTQEKSCGWTVHSVSPLTPCRLFGPARCFVFPRTRGETQ